MVAVFYSRLGPRVAASRLRPQAGLDSGDEEDLPRKVVTRQTIGKLGANKRLAEIRTNSSVGHGSGCFYCAGPVLVCSTCLSQNPLEPVDDHYQRELSKANVPAVSQKSVHAFRVLDLIFLHC